MYFIILQFNSIQFNSIQFSCIDSYIDFCIFCWCEELVVNFCMFSFPPTSLVQGGGEINSIQFVFFPLHDNYIKIQNNNKQYKTNNNKEDDCKCSLSRGKPLYNEYVPLSTRHDIVTVNRRLDTLSVHRTNHLQRIEWNSYFAHIPNYKYTMDA